MENLKIRVNSEAESKEAQELFFELGYEKGAIADYYPSWISNFHEFTPQERKYTSEPADHWLRDCKEITLPELRDLVVLKRNNVGDANVHDEDWCHQNLYLASDNQLYVFSRNTHKWQLSNLNNENTIKRLKPIEKKEMKMKEYLKKIGNNEYMLMDGAGYSGQDNWIEVPEGAEIYIDLGFRNHSFYKDNFKLCWCGVRWENTVHNSMNLEYCSNAPVLWQRHTHPEELPFIDDEPSLNDQYAEIEKVRQSHRTASETSNPTIKETLNQRQSQYGSFEDVAMITEQMVDVMRKGYYENLAYNQKMALYMICSKIARIVNGNPNHKDSWHDIAGYATLIDNELVSEKDMPF